MDDSVARLAALRATITTDEGPSHELARSVTLAVLDRLNLSGSTVADVGRQQFAEAVTALIGEDDWQMTVAVVANMIAVVELSQAEDFAGLSQLVRRYGHRQVAAVQTTADDLLSTGAGMPLASRFTWRVAHAAEIVDALEASGFGRELALDIGHRCYRTGFWLVIADVDPDAPGPELTTVEDAVKCADSGGIQAWRAQVASVAANPWSPYPVELHRLLIDGERPAPADALDSAIKYYRYLSERRDRQLVAREIRRLVAVSGLSQRQFAALCGTSAPRVSTYVNGLVTPSASMMVRFTRVSEMAQRQARRPRSSSA